ncbi:extracellular solute-binding protein [bacterium]|jgi:molybdate transport system substrate-binding protein|nr:extracellular solute-binding protein [bacterium]
MANEINVLSGGAIKRGIADVAKAFESETGCKVNITFATAPAMREKVEKGETGADVICAPVPSMKTFEDNNQVVKGTPIVAGSVMAGVVVKDGAHEPDISSADSLKQAILDAEGLVYNKASSGIYIEKMMENIGVADQVTAKTTRTPTGGGVMEHLIASSSKNEIGFGQMTEIMVFNGRGTHLVGPLPKELENLTTYASAVLSDAASPDQAQQFVTYVATDTARAAFEATGVTPPKK